MSVYRYRLSSDPSNADINSRVIEGIRLRRDVWLTSDDRIDFSSFSNLVEEQQAADRRVFDEMDARPPIPIAQEPSAKKAEAGAPKKKVPEDDAMKKLRERGFSESELAGRSDKYLEELLAFDSSLPLSKRGRHA